MPTFSFKAKSHVLSLLGDELIGSDILAIFELVKNSYDAGAEEVTILLKDLNTSNQQIVVEDDGCGMSLEDLKRSWLNIGTDFKRGKKKEARFNRIPLGEKGVGRLAAHKLGKCILLETKKEDSKLSNRFFINWKKMIDESDYIEDTKVEIESVLENLFEKKHGTRISISKLKKESWTKRDLRELARKVYSIKSPFKRIDNFSVKIIANDHHQKWFEDVKDVEEILKSSIYYFDFKIERNKKSNFAKFSWNYNFFPPKNFKLKPEKKASTIKNNLANKTVLALNIKDENNPFEKKTMHLLNKDLEGIGAICGRFYVYNLLGVILKSFGQTNAIKTYVKENCGIKVFRDGIRVYNYGEPNDDWLGLDLSRVQRLGNHFSKNVVIGAIDIGLEASHSGLKEKTNREGFDENNYFNRFKYICQTAFEFFEKIAQPNRDALKDYLDDIKPVKKIGLSETVLQLKEKLKEKKMDQEFAPLIKRIERDYNNMRDVMLNSGMAGLNISIVFHEVDREIKYIGKDLETNKKTDGIRERVQNLLALLENFSPLLKQNKVNSFSAKSLVEKAEIINHFRLEFHKIKFSSSLTSDSSKDFLIQGPGNLIVSSISNIIDNAIYWTGAKRDLSGQKFVSQIYVDADLENFSGPAIIIADNGDGFNLEPEDLVLPFRTTKPGGMGLGLYFANLVFEMIGGKIEFPDRDEINLSEELSGAIVALVFPRRQ